MKRVFLDGYTLISFSTVDNKTHEVYSFQGEEYILEVEKKNGLRNGTAIMICKVGGNEVGRFTFVDDVINGECILCNKEGKRLFEGNMENFQKVGECKEYSNGKLIFCGFYLDGKRFPYFERIPGSNGFYYERRCGSKQVIAYTQGDEITGKRNGRCFLLNSEGQVEREIYVNNKGGGDGEEVEEEEIRRFSLGEMTEKRNGKVVYQGGYTGDWKSGFIRSGEGKEYNEDGELMYSGLFVKGEHGVVYEEVTDGHWKGYFMEKTLDNKHLSYCQLQPSPLLKDGRCVTFDNDKPTGEAYYSKGELKYQHIVVNAANANEMKEYDEKGTLIYKGGYRFFGISFVRWGTGNEYSSNEELLYEGEFVNGYYHHQGIYYKNKEVLYEGEWYFGLPNGKGKLYEEGKEVEKMDCWSLGYCGKYYFDQDEESAEMTKKERKRMIKERENAIITEYHGNEIKQYNSYGICIYKGEWNKEKNGIYPHGHGTAWVPSNKSFNGCNGKGTANTTSGVSYEGDWLYGYLKTDEGYLAYDSGVLANKCRCCLPNWYSRGGFGYDFKNFMMNVIRLTPNFMMNVIRLTPMFCILCLGIFGDYIMGLELGWNEIFLFAYPVINVHLSCLFAVYFWEEIWDKKHYCGVLGGNLIYQIGLWICGLALPWIFRIPILTNIFVFIVIGVITGSMVIALFLSKLEELGFAVLSILLLVIISGIDIVIPMLLSWGIGWRILFSGVGVIVNLRAIIRIIGIYIEFKKSKKQRGRYYYPYDNDYDNEHFDDELRKCNGWFLLVKSIYYYLSMAMACMLSRPYGVIAFWITIVLLIVAVVLFVYGNISENGLLSIIGIIVGIGVFLITVIYVFIFVGWNPTVYIVGLVIGIIIYGYCWFWDWVTFTISILISILSLVYIKAYDFIFVTPLSQVVYTFVLTFIVIFYLFPLIDYKKDYVKEWKQQDSDNKQSRSTRKERNEYYKYSCEIEMPDLSDLSLS